MKTKMFQKVMALICAAILLVAVLPAGSAQADERPRTPKISVKAVNGTDVEVTIGKTRGADGYEVWITSDCGYKGYKNYNWYMGSYNYNDNIGDYINAVTVEKDGTAVRTVTIKNLSKAKVSVKVRAYSCWRTPVYECGEFSKAKTVKVTAQKKGYKSSYNFSNVNKGDTIKFGTYEQDYPVNGKDPIEWVVLDKTKSGIVVMSKYALDCLPYNTEWTDVTWETCTLRKWLNEKFYNAAFNKTEKAMIRKTTVHNNENGYYETDGGKDTKDKVFLLSIDDLLTESYGFDTDVNTKDINRRCAPSRYAVAQGAELLHGADKDLITADNEAACSWWLRSYIKVCLGKYKYVAYIVNVEGRVRRRGSDVNHDKNAVRPVLVLKLKSE